MTPELLTQKNKMIFGRSKNIDSKIMDPKK